MHWSPVTSPHKDLRRGALIFSLIWDKWLSKQSWGCWFETPSCSLWRYCNAVKMAQRWHGDGAMFTKFYSLALEVVKKGQLSAQTVMKISSIWRISVTVMTSNASFLDAAHCYTFPQETMEYSTQGACHVMNMFKCVIVSKRAAQGVLI